jgi:electron transport complex protein RnfD
VRTGTQAGRLSDYSAVITGLLLALTLPPGFPLWMGAVAGIVAIALGKALFGGIGFNVFNPALVGRAFVQAAFPTAIATYTPSFLPGRFTEFIPVDAWPGR